MNREAGADGKCKTMQDHKWQPAPPSRDGDPWYTCSRCGGSASANAIEEASRKVTRNGSDEASVQRRCNGCDCDGSNARVAHCEFAQAINANPAAVEYDFSCRVCGVQCAIAPPPPARAVCPEHCEDHEYKYERGEQEHRCIHCDAPRPEDWGDE